jgi:hypothetical protein
MGRARRQRPPTPGRLEKLRKLLAENPNWGPKQFAQAIGRRCSTDYIRAMKHRHKLPILTELEAEEKRNEAAQ